MSEQTLPGFDPPPSEPVPGLSRTQRRTLESHRLIQQGRNPATRLPVRQPFGETCGSCVNLVTRGHYDSLLQVRAREPVSVRNIGYP